MIGKANGEMLEVLVGHCTYAALVRRPVLSVFHGVYRFIQAERGKQVVLWPSVVEELQVFRGLMPILSSDWWRRWNPLVSASDASTNGFGVSTSMWTLEEVRQAGRTGKRERFRDCRAVSARVHAMEAAGLGDEAFGQEEEDEDFAMDAAKSIASFPSGLSLSRWMPRFWGAWQYDQNVQVLEARVLVMSLPRVALSPHGRDVRQIMIVDKLGVCLCFDRCRSKNFELLNQIRVFARFVLARNLKPTVRWVPSEFEQFGRTKSPL